MYVIFCIFLLCFQLNFLIRKIKEWKFQKNYCRFLPYFYTYPAHNDPSESMFFFLYRLYKKGTIVCKWTDHPYCICAFLSESFAISKVYHYVVDPIPLLSCWAAHRRFLSAIQCSLTKTFICWPPSLISIVLRFWKRLFTFQSPMCHCGALILSDI